MSLTSTVSAERVHIAFFGRRNAGKSSLMNAVAGQNVSIVSDVKGTTTDPVKKAMEILPLGPVLLTDTPGLDDEGELGSLRADRARQVLASTDIALLVTDGAEPDEYGRSLIALFKQRSMPYLVVRNKADTFDSLPEPGEDEIFVSALTGYNVRELRERLGSFAEKLKSEKTILDGLVSAGDVVVMVIPIDASAPKGRIILPQQQLLRELLDTRCTAVCCQPSELAGTLAALSGKTRLVVTDSQAFAEVSRIVPEDVPLTSFSILFARYKGELAVLTGGADVLGTLRDGDRVLISEGCTHHRQCGDIGTQKLPRMIERFSGAKPEYDFTSGGTFPEDLSAYRLVVHCGGCMLNAAEMRSRMSRARDAGVPMVNYGVAIAKMNGILERSLEALAPKG